MRVFRFRRCRRFVGLAAMFLVGSVLGAVGSGTVDVGVAGASSAPTFVGLKPARLLDTRSGVGAPAAKVGAGQTLVLQVTGRGGVPSSGVAAVSINITATRPTVGSYLTVWPTGQARPTASILNFAAGQTIANSTVVGVSASGQVSIFNSSGSTDVLVDVSGWFPSAGVFTPLTPARLLDTRSGVGAPVAKVGPGQTLVLQVTGRGGVPASGVGAVSVNITATRPTVGSFLTVWPNGQARPTASILNFGAGKTIANSTVVGVSSTGKLSIFNSTGSTDVLVDVSGWFPTGGAFRALTPARLLDTRSGVGAPMAKVGAGQTLVLQVTGRGGVPASGVGAVSVNITATRPTAASYLTAWPNGQSRPTASILNFAANQTIANSTIVGVSSAGRVSIYNSSGSTDMLVDVSGWFPTVGVTQVAASLMSTCALASVGTVKCWGGNRRGQLGDGTTTDRSSPVAVTGLSGVTQIASNEEHMCALLQNGTVRCWGYNNYGQLGDGTTTNRSTPVTVAGLSGVAHIAVGHEHSCAALTNGTAKCWGRNGFGRLGDGTTVSRMSPVSVVGLTNVARVAAGGDYSCAVLADGTVKCWGANALSQLGDGTTFGRLTPVTTVGVSGIAEIDAGYAHTCAFDDVNDLVDCWGYNYWGQLGDGTSINRSTSNPVAGLNDAMALGAGASHSCAVRVPGVAECWGNNADGQVGDGTLTDRWNRTPVNGLTGLEAIDAGGAHTCALTTTGTVWCWGDNQYGQLSDATTTDRLTPTAVIGLP